MKVLTFSRHFPKGHPKAGQPTWFVEKIEACLADTIPGWEMSKTFTLHEWLPYYNCTTPKHHTIRAVRGLTNWNGGLVFDEVQADLEAEGYEVLPFLLPAAGVNAPHRRDRIWFIAHANGDTISLPIQQWGQDKAKDIDAGRQSEGGIITHANIEHRPAMGLHEERNEKAGLEPVGSRSWSGGYTWEVFPTQSPVCGGNDGLPKRLDGITVRKWKEESLKALGNSVVPQVVYQIFKAIEQYEISL